MSHQTFGTLHAEVRVTVAGGIIDFGRVFAEVDQPGETEFIIERDDAGVGALETARVGYEFLRTIRFRPPDAAA